MVGCGCVRPSQTEKRRLPPGGLENALPLLKLVLAGQTVLSTKRTKWRTSPKSSAAVA